jgi:hypothetical protein
LPPPAEAASVLHVVREHPIGIAVVGMLIAGGIAGVASASGSIPTAYAIVAGLSVATPPLNLGRGGASFDREGYLSDGNEWTVAVDSVAAGGTALAFGVAGVFGAEALGIRPGALLVAIAAGVTALAGQIAFFFRTVDYRSIGPEEGEADDEASSEADGGSEDASGPE